MGAAPYLCWVGGGSAAGFELIRFEDGRHGAIYPGCTWAPAAAAAARERSGLDWLPRAGVEAAGRDVLHVERRRSPVARVVARLAAEDPALCLGVAAEDRARRRARPSRAWRADGDDVAREGWQLARRCDGLPSQRWRQRGRGPVEFVLERGDMGVIDAIYASLRFYTRADRPDLQTVPLEALIAASGWDRYADVVDERAVVEAEWGGPCGQLALL